MRNKKHSGRIFFGAKRTFARAFGIILPLCIFSAAFAAFAVYAANDIYAFAKPDREIKIELDGKKSLSEIAQLFEAGGVIGNSYFFELYARKKGAEANLTAYSGEILLNSKMSYREIILEFF